MDYTIDNLLTLFKPGIKYSAIAKELGTTKGAVSGKISRLRKKGLLPKRGVVVKPPKEKKMKPNRNTIVFVGRNQPQLTKNELRAELKRAVENTR